MIEANIQPLLSGRRRTFCCHRATLSGGLPPNSLAAVRECVAAGVPRLEIDVRFLVDDAMVIFHDSDLATETTGTGRIEALDEPAVRRLRLNEHRDVGLCFLEDVVDAMRGSQTLLQVDLKLMRPLSASRERRLREALVPLGEGVLTGSQAHWNLRPLAAAGLRVAFDPSLQWRYDPHRTVGDGLTPARLGVHGLWDDAPIAHIRHVAPRDYVLTRVDDLVGLLPSAVEWMVDIATLIRIEQLGLALGDELEARGIALAAWTMADQGPERSVALLQRLFAIGATTVITDHSLVIAGYARHLA